MVLLDEPSFLSRLGDLIDANRGQGTVYLQMKRFAGRLASVRRKRFKRQVEAAKGVDPQCLIRARSNKGDTSKLSVRVDAKDTVRFQLGLGNVMRLKVDGLKRREKKKQVVKEEKEKEKKKPVRTEKGKEAKASKKGK
uniref:Signal recognition particle 14 kDa protein n=1 Tax=Alexandrium monilatum TaxID=311494 RepID=A0A7S4R5M2_9DINO